MLQIGTQVVYGIHGVCVIVGVEIRRVDRKKVEYFVLEPTEQPGARYYVPRYNETARAKLRPLLAREELDALFASASTHQDIWIEDENHRRQKYRELINSGDRGALISMIRALQRHKENQLAAGRKFHLSDENFLRDAERMLSSEFSMVLNMSPAEAKMYIENRIQE